MKSKKWTTNICQREVVLIVCRGDMTDGVEKYHNASIKIFTSVDVLYTDHGASWILLLWTIPYRVSVIKRSSKINK